MFKKNTVLLTLPIILSGCATAWYADVPFYKQPTSGEISSVSVDTDRPVRVYVVDGSKYPSANCVNSFKSRDTLWVDQVLPKQAGSKKLSFGVSSEAEKYFILSDVHLGMYTCTVTAAFTPHVGLSYKISYEINDNLKVCRARVDGYDNNGSAQAVDYRSIPYECKKS